MEIAHLDARFHGQQARIAFGTDASDALVMKFGGTEAGVAGWTMMSDQDYRDGLAAGDDMAEGHRRHGGFGAARFESDGSVRGLRNAVL